jgi:hypothetical protein
LITWYSFAVQLTVPPPGAVHELAEKAVDFVQRALGLTLDYTLETLPLLDHYLRQVPRDQPDTVRLVGATAGAYVGEVARRALGGEWDDVDGVPSEWRMTLAGGVRISPAGLATLAVLQADTEGVDGEIDVPARAREAVEDALTARGSVAEDEYYSLSGRLEVLMLVCDVVAASAIRS